MIKAVIFDMDGLMLDTERLILEHWIKVGPHFGYDIDEEIMLKVVGIRMTESGEIIRAHYGDDFPLENIRKKVHEDISSYIQDNGAPKKKGLIEILEYCKNNNLKIAVATSSHRDSAEYLLIKAGVIDYFDTIVCGDDIRNGKPDPEIYLKASDKLEVKPINCVVLEDSKYGILGANNAGMMSIFIPDLVKECDEISNKATAKCESLNDAISVIDNWIKIYNN